MNKLLAAYASAPATKALAAAERLVRYAIAHPMAECLLTPSETSLLNRARYHYTRDA